jgi:multimeric flavodoxin WrbA
MATKILGIVGSYRKGGVIDAMISEVLAAARKQGAETEKIYLMDKRLDYCRNCRACTQAPGVDPGICVIDDDMAAILDRYLQSDGIVIGAPVNFGNVNALTRTFIERLVCFAYWPWGKAQPGLRKKNRGKRAVLITSTAMPAVIARFATGAKRALESAASAMGAETVAYIPVGMISMEEQPKLPERAMRKAHEAGKKLASAG